MFRALKGGRLAEKGPKLLKNSNGSNVYPFALADLYTSTNRLSKTLSTPQAAILPSQRTHADAVIFHQIGRFGVLNPHLPETPANRLAATAPARSTGPSLVFPTKGRCLPARTHRKSAGDDGEPGGVPQQN
ncbi:hypothetical protein VP01_2496g3 [Puccinia sorghi]|uniref:Uncharacterized protein n=1 Tax=Puccinia sorghi TaxID=27349 RepID=A0A0L6V6D4_9BASI|nr:hypothetical protein VP01_2496g3 [Puccinia sorghi]